ncbi:MAG: D-3-phosphoglycerate dehydrogenase [bacterium]|nr:D-3-phosphoglycerate dehydrogenase [bacterium]
MSEMKFRILICDGMDKEGLAILQREPGFEVDARKSISREDLLKEIGTADAVIVRSASQIDAEAIEAGKNLKVVARAGVGIDNVDTEAATRRGIVVMNTPEGNTTSAAEHTMALMLALLRNVPQADATMRAGGWDRSKFVGREAYGKVLGIVGLGRIGRQVAKRAQAFEMKTIGYDPFSSPESAAADGIELVDLETLFQTADIVTLHTPLTEDTRGLINRETVAKMKRGAFVVNTARGQLVVEEDLAEALKSGQLAGAALDVYPVEPPKDTPFIGLPNVITTPHLGASTNEAQVNVAISAATQVVDALLDREIRNAVNMPRLDPESRRVLGPFIQMADKLGQFAAQITEGTMEKILVHCQGEITAVDTAPVTTGALRGAISILMPETVNYVNAGFLAKMRGLSVESLESSEATGFTSLVSLTITTNKASITVAGTIFKGQDVPRIVLIDDYQVEARPIGDLLLIRNKDLPGVVGHVGTVLSRNGININGMSLGPNRDRPVALEIINVNKPVPTEVIEELKKSELILSATPIRIR